MEVLAKDEFGNFKKYSLEDIKSVTESRLAFLETIVSRLESHSYKLFKQPLVVEVSLADLEDIRNSRTPYKVLGRITRVRKALGFGDKLFA